MYKQAPVAPGFHPFQGRAPFGRGSKQTNSSPTRLKFPSLSGKSSIRTNQAKAKRRKRQLLDFHPFQGRAPFGLTGQFVSYQREFREFPSLSGKSSIRTAWYGHKDPDAGFYVSIPFREDLYSDTFATGLRVIPCIPRFHPFQGRPSFGPYKVHGFNPSTEEVQFPSLSGKTFIRTGGLIECGS